MPAARAAAAVGLLRRVDTRCCARCATARSTWWVLDLALLALCGRGGSPCWAGSALALAVHLKLYPLVLLLPLALARCGRAVGWTAVGFAAIVLAQTELGRDWTPWLQFADFYSRVYPGEVAIRNSSFHAIAFNTLHLLFDLPPASLRAPVRFAATLFSLAMGLWLLLRGLARQRIGGDALIWTRRPLAFSLLS